MLKFPLIYGLFITKTGHIFCKFLFKSQLYMKIIIIYSLCLIICAKDVYNAVYNSPYIDHFLSYNSQLAHIYGWFKQSFQQFHSIIHNRSLQVSLTENNSRYISLLQVGVCAGIVLRYFELPPIYAAITAVLSLISALKYAPYRKFQCTDLS